MLMAWSVAQVRGTIPPLMVILAGMVVSSLFSALVSLVKYAADPRTYFLPYILAYGKHGIHPPGPLLLWGRLLSLQEACFCSF